MYFLFILIYIINRFNDIESHIKKESHNKFKDNQVIERIKNDPNLDMTTKTNCIQQYIKQVQEQCNLDRSAQPTAAVQNIAAFQNNAEERFTGKHNIDDITSTPFSNV